MTTLFIGFMVIGLVSLSVWWRSSDDSSTNGYLSSTQESRDSDPQLRLDRRRELSALRRDRYSSNKHQVRRKPGKADAPSSIGDRATPTRDSQERVAERLASADGEVEVGSGTPNGVLINSDPTPSTSSAAAAAPTTAVLEAEIDRYLTKNLFSAEATANLHAAIASRLVNSVLPQDVRIRLVDAQSQLAANEKNARNVASRLAVLLGREGMLAELHTSSFWTREQSELIRGSVRAEPSGERVPGTVPVSEGLADDQPSLAPVGSVGRTAAAASPAVVDVARTVPKRTGATTYRVRPGDTVHDIARAHQVDFRELIRVNESLQRDPDRLRIGIDLRIPSGASAILGSPSP